MKAVWLLSSVFRMILWHSVRMVFSLQSPQVLLWIRSIRESVLVATLKTGCSSLQPVALRRTRSPQKNEVNRRCRETQKNVPLYILDILDIDSLYLSYYAMII